MTTQKLTGVRPPERDGSHSHEEWEKTTLHESMEKLPERQEAFRTTSSADVTRLTSADHLMKVEPPGFPGEYPYTRGIHPTMYRSRLWTMRQFAGFGTAEQTNERFRFLLSQGQTGLSTAFDLPTLYGYDSDSEWAKGEVGVEGVAVDSLRDMEVLFSGIPLGKVSTSMTINSPAAIILAMYVAVAEKQGVDYKDIAGTIQNDILKEYIAQKEFIFPPEPSMRLVVDSIEYCTKHLPKFNSVSISGYHIREAGSTALQELAFTLADGYAYVEACIARGLDVDDFAPRLSFFFNSHNDLFEEVAKFRAARRVWAKLMREKYKAKNPRSWMLRFHTQTAGCSLQPVQPEVNIVRTTVQALAAVLGGTQSLHTNSMDEALSLPTEKAVQIALRTQQVLAHESGVAQMVDPLGGSFFVEKLTQEMEDGCFEYFRRIEEYGGVVAALENGFFQREITDASFRYQKEIESNERLIVGINAFQAVDEDPLPIHRVDASAEKRQLESLHSVRATRDVTKVKECLERIKAVAKGKENLMYPILDAVRAYATVGEICDAFREVWGEYREPAIF